MSYRFMRRVPRLVGGVSLVLMGAGCATTGDNPPLIFGQTQGDDHMAKGCRCYRLARLNPGCSSGLPALI